MNEFLLTVMLNDFTYFSGIIFLWQIHYCHDIRITEFSISVMTGEVFKIFVFIEYMRSVSIVSAREELPYK